MNNQEYVKKIVSYIRTYMEKNNITQKKLESLCREKNIAVSQGTISNIFSKPSSARLSTLINICDGLDISLSSLMKSIELSKKSPDPSTNLMIYDTSDPSYRGYLKKYHIYFLTTNEKNNGQLVHGILDFKKQNTPSPCKAILSLDTGDLDPNTNKPLTKTYSGEMVISRVGCIYCNLISYEYGDIWTLAFNHIQLNMRSFIGAIGCGITSSSGSMRVPTIHKVFLSSTELTEDQKCYVGGLLRLYLDDITISKQQLNAFMNNSDLDVKFKNNIERVLSKPETFYNIPLNMITPRVPNESYTKSLSLLLQYSAMPFNDKITRSETDLAPYIISPRK